MNPDTLWQLYQSMSGHIEVLNREMGMVLARMDWVEWWIKMIVGGTVVNSAMNFVNLWLSYKTSKNNKK